MSHFYDTYFSPKTTVSTSKLQEYKKRYKNDSETILNPANNPYKTLNSPSESYLTPSSMKLSQKMQGSTVQTNSNESKSSLNALKALQGKVKTLENIIEMKDKEKEIIIKNYQDLTEKIRADLETIRSVERELRRSLKETEEHGMQVRGQLEKEIAIISEKYKEKTQETQVLSLRLEEKTQFIHETLTQFKQENSALKANSDKLNVLNQTLYKEIDEYKEKLHSLEEINKELGQRTQEAQKEVFEIKSTYDEAITRYKEEFKEYQESNQEKIGVLEARIEELMDEKRSLENELKESRVNNELLQKQVDSKDIEIMRIKQKEIVNSSRENSRGLSLERNKYSTHNNNNMIINNNLNNNALISLREEIEIDRQELERNKAKTLLNNNSNNANAIENYKTYSPNKEISSTYTKTLQSIKELDKEITQMNQEYQDLLIQSQSAKLTKDKEGVKQKMFNLNEMLRDATSKMYSLRKEEDFFTK